MRWVQYNVSAWQELPICNFCFEVVGRQHFRQMKEEGRQAEVILRYSHSLPFSQEAELCKVDEKVTMNFHPSVLQIDRITRTLEEPWPAVSEEGAC